MGLCPKSLIRYGKCHDSILCASLIEITLLVVVYVVASHSPTDKDSQSPTCTVCFGTKECFWCVYVIACADASQLYPNSLVTCLGRGNGLGCALSTRTALSLYQNCIETLESVYMEVHMYVSSCIYMYALHVRSRVSLRA